MVNFLCFLIEWKCFILESSLWIFFEVANYIFAGKKKKIWILYKSQYLGKMWEKKKNFCLKLFCVLDILEFLAFFVLLICRGGTWMAQVTAPLGWYLTPCDIPMQAAGHGCEKACGRFPQIGSGVCYQLVRTRLTNWKLAKCFREPKVARDDAPALYRRALFGL